MPRSATKRWSVYVLRCGDGSLYCGVAIDVARRLSQHQAGRGARYTRGRGPLQIAATVRLRDQSTALRVEAAFKRLPRARKEVIITRGLARWLSAR